MRPVLKLLSNRSRSVRFLWCSRTLCNLRAYRLSIKRRSPLRNTVWYMCVCVRACVRACVHACIVCECVRACAHACVRACMHACMHACMRVASPAATAQYLRRMNFLIIMAARACFIMRLDSFPSSALPPPSAHCPSSGSRCMLIIAAAAAMSCTSQLQVGVKCLCELDDVLDDVMMTKRSRRQPLPHIFSFFLANFHDFALFLKSQ